MDNGTRDVNRERGCQLWAADNGDCIRGHDSQNMATLAPTGMIFVPSHGGRSHCPAEHTDFTYLEQGANTLLQTMIQLTQS